MRFLGILVLGVFLLGAGVIPAKAEKITPSHVNQVVENLVNELTLLLDANFSDADVPLAEVKGKMPRHVIQGSQELLRKIEVLKQVNGLKMDPIEPIEVREIKPADVKGQVDRVLKEVRDLRGTFKVSAKAAAAPLREGMTPNDPYARILQASAMIDRLDIPKIVPNDVLRLALAILADVKQIHAKVGAPAPEPVEGDFSAKKPPEVYARSREVLQELKVLVGVDAYAIPKGIMVPAAKEGKLTPADVLEMQNTVLAELSSIKVKVGATEPTPVIPPQSGKTPGDVFATIEEAMSYVKAIQSKASGG